MCAAKISRLVEIYKLIKEHGINNPDGSIDLIGDIDLSNLGLPEIPFKIRNLFGDFDCSNNQLTSLKNAPDWVSGDFDCSNNKLTSLEDGPSYVGGDFYCAGNPNLKSWGSNTSRNINGNIYSYAEYLKTNKKEMEKRKALKIGLVACSKSKQGKDDPTKKFKAQEIYTGNSFGKSKEYCLDKANGFNEWYILSEEHELLDKNKMISYYDKYLGDLSRKERRAWAATVLDELGKKYDLQRDLFYIFGGTLYYENLSQHLNCVVFEYKGSNSINLEAPRIYTNGGK